MKKVAPGLLLLGGLLFCGCRTAKDVAVSSFRVIDAPANYLRRHLDEPRTTTTTTTTTSDVTNPGQPIVATAPQTTAVSRRTTTDARSTSRTSHNASVAATTRPLPPAPQRSAQQTQQFPTAKPVPGKPGFVFSPFDPNGGYVDVTGYASGSKAKDPYSQKVFIVP